jgi:dihydroorotate dehydrogenase (fumarate)
MIDLTTTYLGHSLKNPLVVSASPLGYDLGNIREMEDRGAAAVVLPSLFEEQLDLEGAFLSQNLSRGEESFPEAVNYFPDLNNYHISSDRYLDLIRQAKAAVEIPIIASLNGSSDSGWVRFARQMEQAGADAIELNIYYLPTSPDLSGAEVEHTYCQLVRAVSSEVKIPVAVKLGPYFSSLPHAADKLVAAGARALVLFNRFYQPDFDLEQLEVTPRLTLSTSHELNLRLHWVAILFNQVEADLAVTGGVHTAIDVLKAMMAGAQVAMMTSALLMHGIGHLFDVHRNVVRWMEEHEYESIRQMQGSMSRRSAANHEAFERANYIKVLSSYTPSKLFAAK